MAARYFGGPFFRRVFASGSKTASILAASSSLTRLKVRSRSMFLRTAVACRSISAIARAPSSAAKRCRLARATLSGESCDDFLPAMRPIPQQVKPAQSEIERAPLPFQYIREMALTVQASDRFSALDLPRILSALISKLTF